MDQIAHLIDVRLGVVARERDHRNAQLVAEPVGELLHHAALLDTEDDRVLLALGAVPAVLGDDGAQRVTGTRP